MRLKEERERRRREKKEENEAERGEREGGLLEKRGMGKEK